MAYCRSQEELDDSEHDLGLSLVEILVTAQFGQPLTVIVLSRELLTDLSKD